MVIAVLIVLGAVVLVMIGMALGEAYAAGWNASVRHHMGRDPMDPFWTTYK